MSAGKPHFTNEQYRYARDHANALEYAQRHGYDLVRQGSNKYHLREHDSMVFTTDGRWFWNSHSLKGRAIEFLMHYEGKTLPEAVLALCEAAGPVLPTPNEPPSVPVSPQKPPFILPERSPNCRRLFAYLCNTRKLDKEIVSDLVRSGDVYESTRRYISKSTQKEKEAHNAVFVGRDSTGTPRSAFQRGLTSFSDANAYKRDVTGSDPSAPFCLPGKRGTKTVIVFEAAIDAISHASLLKNAALDHQSCDRVAIGGTQKAVGLFSYLDHHPNIDHIVLAMDMDEAGRTATEKIASQIYENYSERYTISEIHPGLGKDWNEYLQVWHETISTQLAQHNTPLVALLDERNKVAAINFCDNIRTYREMTAVCLRSGERIVAKPPPTSFNPSQIRAAAAQMISSAHPAQEIEPEL